eukprot:gb/GEZN01019075.1/.p1 GENE.gb/GEZN01019075.1/~~gb/GEZN01019075.1/.p1  ORF type:complete len:143 (+),score=18.33 gb/GEZN01019075.1/:34-462(+)
MRAAQYTTERESMVMQQQRRLLSVQEGKFRSQVRDMLLSPDPVPPTTLRKSQLVIYPADYEAVVEERRHQGRCGWPGCINVLPTTAIAKLKRRKEQEGPDAKIPDVVAAVAATAPLQPGSSLPLAMISLSPIENLYRTSLQH